MMTSGVFSRKSRLSPKALRLYDEMGLLRPAEVDESNGYRYYADSQVETAKLISLLRTLEMPLATIADVIAMEAREAVDSIGAYWRDTESPTTRSVGWFAT